jgi:signal transduction histidine kinase
VIRSSDDVELLSGPPWWTVNHLAIMALGMLGMGFLMHLFYSHAQERRRAAILEERERLAYEMHDTLAQSFAGLDFQMRAIRNYLQHNLKKMDAARIRSEVARACDLVRHSHDEARRSLTALRPEILEKQGLSNALTQVARQMVAGNQMTVDVRVIGEPRPLPVRITDGCFRIGQEAIANAVRHSHARRIAIQFDYQRTSFLMAIEDNGRGFLENPDSDSFGITGIRRRAKEINGELRIDTGNSGTRISVFVPSTR